MFLTLTNGASSPQTRTAIGRATDRCRSSAGRAGAHLNRVFVNTVGWRSERARSRRARALVAAIAAWLALAAFPALAAADEIADLSARLASSRREKVRISAAVSLGRLKDRRAVRPLVRALRRDRSPLVRAVAAAALGYIGDPRAVPALRKAAADPEDSVRKRAREALARIDRAQSGRQVASGALSERERRARAQSIRVAPRERPSLAPAPTLYVQLKSVTDKSRRRASKRHRVWTANTMRSLLHDELQRSPEVTLDERSAVESGARHFAVDVTITNFNRRVRGPWVEIVCEVRLAVSNRRGRLLSFLTGGATVQVPKKTFKTAYEPQLRKEALENAAKSMRQDLMAYLQRELRN